MLVQIAQALKAEVNDLIYPAAKPTRRFGRIEPLSPGFVIWSVVLYFILFVFGGVYIGIPLFRAVLGGGIQEEFLYMLY